MNDPPADWHEGSTLAFFCSQSCPGDIILKSQDWANTQIQSGPSIIGGFHTAVERDVLRILLRRRAPVILVLARSVAGWRPSTAIKRAIDADILRVLSPFGETQRRTTRESALARNIHILSHCSAAVFAHASPGSATERLARDAAERGISISTFRSKHNANLLEMGATEVNLEN